MYVIAAKVSFFSLNKLKYELILTPLTAPLEIVTVQLLYTSYTVCLCRSFYCESVAMYVYLRKLLQSLTKRKNSLIEDSWRVSEIEQKFLNTKVVGNV